jgi:hypothetical protein
MVPIGASANPSGLKLFLRSEMEPWVTYQFVEDAAGKVTHGRWVPRHHSIREVRERYVTQARFNRHSYYDEVEYETWFEGSVWLDVHS